MYLRQGAYLLHGDYYPASWLKTAKGIQIIDPEFCCYGLREFDVAVFIAHLHLTKQPQAIIDSVLTNYYDAKGLNMAVLHQFIAVEIMRRLIGLAQLPLKMDLGDKAKLLQFAYTLIMK